MSDSNPPFKVKSIYEYQSDYDDDLTFPVGQIITVTGVEDEEWYSGSYEGKTGIFPKNFVELAKEDSSAELGASGFEKKKETSSFGEPEPKQAGGDGATIIQKEQQAATNIARELETGNKETEGKDTERPEEAANTEIKQVSEGLKTRKPGSTIAKAQTFDKGPHTEAPKPIMPGQKIHDPYSIKKQFLASSKTSYVPPVKPRDSSNLVGHPVEEKAKEREIERSGGDSERKEIEERKEREGRAEKEEKEEKEEKPQVSLKERIALLQQRQREEAEREEAMAQRREERKHRQAEEKEIRNKQKQDTSAAQIPGAEPREDAYDSYLGFVEENYGNTGTEDFEEIGTLPRTVSEDEGGREERHVDEGEEKVADREEENEEENESEDEDLRRQRLVERMARISGGRNMFGMMGLAPSFDSAKSKKKDAGEKPAVSEKRAHQGRSKEEESRSQLPNAIPVMPFADPEKLGKKASLSGAPHKAPSNEDLEFAEQEEEEEKFDDAVDSHEKVDYDAEEPPVDLGSDVNLDSSKQKLGHTVDRESKTIHDDDDNGPHSFNFSNIVHEDPSKFALKEENSTNRPDLPNEYMESLKLPTQELLVPRVLQTLPTDKPVPVTVPHGEPPSPIFPINKEEEPLLPDDISPNVGRKVSAPLVPSEGLAPPIPSEKPPPSIPSGKAPPSIPSGKAPPSIPSERPSAPSVPSERPPPSSIPSERPPAPSVPSERPPPPSIPSERPPAPSIPSERPPAPSVPSERPSPPSIPSERPPGPSASSGRPPIPGERPPVPSMPGERAPPPSIPSERPPVPPTFLGEEGPRSPSDLTEKAPPFKVDEPKAEVQSSRHPKVSSTKMSIPSVNSASSLTTSAYPPSPSGIHQSSSVGGFAPLHVLGRHEAQYPSLRTWASIPEIQGNESDHEEDALYDEPQYAREAPEIEEPEVAGSPSSQASAGHKSFVSSMSPSNHELRHSNSMKSRRSDSLKSRKSVESTYSDIKQKGNSKAEKTLPDFEYAVANISSSSNWWLQSDLPEVLAERAGVDLIYEVECNTIPKRGSRNVNYKDYYILFQDLSQLIFEIEYESEDPRTTVRLINHFTKEPPVIRKNILDTYSRNLGSKLIAMAESSVGKKITTYFVYSLFEELARSGTNILMPIGDKAFGVSVYRNVNNHNIAKIDDVKPGDILCVKNARLSVHKSFAGIGGKSVSLGEGSNTYSAVIDFYDPKKDKLAVIEQNSSGQVKKDSLRISEIKGGTIRIFRAVGREYIGW